MYIVIRYVRLPQTKQLSSARSQKTPEGSRCAGALHPVRFTAANSEMAIAVANRKLLGSGESKGVPWNAGVPVYPARSGVVPAQRRVIPARSSQNDCGDLRRESEFEVVLYPALSGARELGKKDENTTRTWQNRRKKSGEEDASERASGSVVSNLSGAIVNKTSARESQEPLRASEATSYPAQRSVVPA